MKQYRLLRDLPGIKAGEMGETKFDECLEFGRNDIYLTIPKKYIPAWISEGWIEEVEEKEFTRKDVVKLYEGWLHRCLLDPGNAMAFEKFVDTVKRN